ncbi:MAG: 3-dehydroquinate synthase [Saprospiraceae bacterium]|nr:3-dehydroquinate synthase [Saprospiraceae bacterium]
MRISCNNYNIYLNEWDQLNKFIQSGKYDQVYVLVDENTEKYCLHILFEHIEKDLRIIRIQSGEKNKNLETCAFVWSELIRKGADRHSLLVNLGGGVIGDLGGFCAATFMRGIDFIQLPTTLLSQVDASVGGKLGIDFNGYKNMIGLFSDPKQIFIFTGFLQTLPGDQLRSGYAELLKHGLIADKNSWAQLSLEKEIRTINFEPLVYESVMIKKAVTEEDPYEKGNRKILNFGHTIGHAIESFWLDKKTPILHGDAIAIGMVSESYLSYRKGTINEMELFEIRNALIRIYGHHPGNVKDREKITELMLHDKKNRNGAIHFSLLNGIGRASYDIPVSLQMIDESLLFYSQKLYPKDRKQYRK